MDSLACDIALFCDEVQNCPAGAKGAQMLKQFNTAGGIFLVTVTRGRNFHLLLLLLKPKRLKQGYAENL